MRKWSKFLAIILVVAMVLPGIGQAAPVEEKNVNRLSGDDRVLTAIAASKEVYKEGANSVVLAGFNGEVDALTGTLLAGEKDAPLLLTKRAELSPATEKELKSLNPKTVYILGGEKVVSKEVEAKLKKSYTVERVEGANRYETAVNVAKKVKGKTATHVFLALGREAVKGDALADALAIGPVSAKEKMPVFLTEKDKLPKETKEALVDLGVTDVTILGGPLAISEKVEKELKGYKLNRVEGNNRYETALEIAKKYFGSPESVVLAYGWKSADALVGGYLGAKKDAPILLTNKDKLDDKTEKYIKDNSNKAYILGGTTVVGEDVFKKVESATYKIDNAYFNEVWYAFEKTINKQAQNTNPKEKVTAKFDASKKNVNIKILDSYQREGVMAIVFETGLKEAITNILISEKVTKISSEGHVVETLNKNGVKKDSKTLQGEAIGIATPWLGDNALHTPMKDYLVGNTFEFIIYGEKENQEEFSITYKLYFH